MNKLTPLMAGKMAIAQAVRFRQNSSKSA